MHTLKVILLSVFVTSAFLTTSVMPVAMAQQCGKNKTFFGIPTWYKYLEFTENCEIQVQTKLDTNDNGVIDADEKENDFSDIWLIVIALIEILLTLAGILAVVFVIIGGFKFVTSQGDPQRIANARQTILYAVIGVIITIIAVQIVSYIGRNLS